MMRPPPLITFLLTIPLPFPLSLLNQGKAINCLLFKHLFLDNVVVFFCERKKASNQLNIPPLSPPLCTLNSKYVGVSMQNDKRDTSQTTTIELRQTTLSLSLAK